MIFPIAKIVEYATFCSVKKMTMRINAPLAKSGFARFTFLLQITGIYHIFVTTVILNMKMNYNYDFCNFRNSTSWRISKFTGQMVESIKTRMESRLLQRKISFSLERGKSFIQDKTISNL